MQFCNPSGRVRSTSNDTLTFSPVSRSSLLARLRTVWYLLRSILVLRAASARAVASKMGVRG